MLWRETRVNVVPHTAIHFTKSGINSGTNFVVILQTLFAIVRIYVIRNVLETHVR
jgi:hypothetical protein